MTYPCFTCRSEDGSVLHANGFCSECRLRLESVERDMEIQVLQAQLKASQEREALLRKELDAKVGRQFPVLGAGFSIPWWTLLPYEAQAQRNHDQSLEQLAVRGGLDVKEILHVIHGLTHSQANPYQWDDPRASLLAWVKRHTDQEAQERFTAATEAMRGELHSLRSEIPILKDRAQAMVSALQVKLEASLERAESADEEMERVFVRAAESEAKTAKLCSIHQFANVECRMCSPAVRELEVVREVVAGAQMALNISRFQADSVVLGVRAALNKVAP